jgi:phosphatidate cytidylyltransferase
MNETLKRAISGAVYIVLLLGSILYSTESFFLLFGIFLLIAVYEFCNLVHINKIFPLLFATLFYTTIIAISFYKDKIQFEVGQYLDRSIIINVNINKLNLILLVIALVVSIKCMMFLFYDSIDKISNSSKYFYLLGYVILPFVFITKISYGVNSYNPKIIIGLFILIWTNDTFAYIVGKTLGGLVFAMIAGVLISKYYIQASNAFAEKSMYIWVSIALIVGFFGTIGDLIESKFKRIAGVKDSGKIMPGHGGILDRLDSVIFVAPIVYLFYQILYYVS